MSDHVIDLRSDTVTRPTEGMLAAMARAPLGDDVFGDDPSVNALEEKTAELLGKEAAMFVPSGTMSNQIAINVHTRPGDDLLCDISAHINRYEAGAPAVLSGVTVRGLSGENGLITRAQLEGCVHAVNHHYTRTRLVSLENTHNAGGGRIHPYEEVVAISKWASKNGLRMHLDGARLMNAVVATGIAAREWSRHFDTVSICFSKGLGAPVGSALAGPRELIDEARFIRKRWGGGMRQAGILAAAASYALDHHVERLQEDHENAQLLAWALEKSPHFDVLASDIQTNIIWAPMNAPRGAEFVEFLERHGVRILLAGADRVRFVTHLDLSRSDAERVAGLIAKFR